MSGDSDRTADAPEPADGLSTSSAAGRWVLAACVLGSGITGIDSTVVNIALPAIGHDLGVGFASLQWTVTAYSVTLASLILLGGALGDRFGRRRIFLIGVVWFALASVACAVAPTVGWLIAARALQGVGGALLTPASLAIIEASFRGQDRARAVGTWSGLSGTASALAPFIGGWLLIVGGWPWVFLINPVLAVPIVVLALRHVPETRDPAASGPIDGVGSALCVIGLGSLTAGLIGAGSRGFGSPVVLVPMLLGLAGLVAFVLVERRQRHPMLPMTLFRSRQFSAANAVTFLLYAANGGAMLLLVIALQTLAGFSPLVAGSALLPITAMMLLLAARFGSARGPDRPAPADGDRPADLGHRARSDDPTVARRQLPRGRAARGAGVRSRPRRVRRSADLDRPRRRVGRPRRHRVGGEQRGRPGRRSVVDRRPARARRTQWLVL